MTSHAILADLLDATADVAHDPDDCDLCARLDIRRTLHGLAEQLLAAQAEVNGTPHPRPPASPRPTPKPGGTAPPKGK